MILPTRLFQTRLSRVVTATVLLTGLWLGSQPPPAQAGCGCDKPPPELAEVRPNATYAGSELTLFHASLQAGQDYSVTLTSGTQAGQSATVTVQAVTRRDLADGVAKPQLNLSLPALPLGPTSISVTDQNGPVLSLSDAAFTVAPAPVVLPEALGEAVLADYQAAVSRAGVVYVSLDVSAMHLPRTFQAEALGYPLRFTNNDIVFYNTQGFLMQLLDEGMPGLFDLEASPGSLDSDILQYSRHEFNTHFLQHKERQTHAVDGADADWHLDGTPHINHDHLIIAISGMLDDGTPPVPGATPAFDLLVSTSSFFQYGLVGDASVELKNGSVIDSYDAATDSYGSQGNVLSNGKITLQNSAVIDGNATGAEFELKNNVKITGEKIVASDVTEFLPVDVPNGLEDIGSIELSGFETLTLGPGSYQLSRLSVTGKASLHIDNTDGPVTLYVTGPVEVTRDARITTTASNSEQFAVYVAGEQQVHLKGRGTFYGVVYAPESTLQLQNSAELFGAFVGHELSIKNGAQVHYDVALRGGGSASGDAEPADAGEEFPDAGDEAADIIQITKVKYDSKKGKLTVQAESDAGLDAQLTISIEGVVTSAPMTAKGNKGDYEYKLTTGVNLDGRLLMLTSAIGGTASVVID